MSNIGDNIAAIADLVMDEIEGAAISGDEATVARLRPIRDALIEAAEAAS